ncbi:MAG: Ldh family oxidoreductase [Mesorhizobium sp.]|uniref:Ldh family oxidoreductase n=1 Tax=Mesorhizobium sp. TaxID=1871066 RepID=UPI00120A4F35|nr:Ldh family oxidoreductase [Mesorhizobium sp.]TIQ18310.1 MAG: Ldh family oxidoreductase [Mesorhizobium sp.]
MQLTLSDAHALATDVLIRHGVNGKHAGIVADHLVDAAAAGHAFAGLPRILALVENLKKRPPARQITVTAKSANAAVVDGGGTNGYVTSLVGIDKAIELATQNGVGIVGISDTWFSGRLAYYVERAARKGFIAMHTANTMARVAPSGGIDRIFGTNPIAFAFPADPDPLVVDFGTGMTTWGDVLLRQKLGKPLELGVAVDLEGRPTIDPTEALDGAFMPWGGHRGYGLSLVVQVLGILCGSATIVEDVSDCGFFFLVFNPELLMPLGQFRASVTKLVDQIETSRPAAGISKVRVPGRSSAVKRREAEKAGTIEVDEAIFEALDRMRREQAEA